jgi:hypothetical protein
VDNTTKQTKQPESVDTSLSLHAMSISQNEEGTQAGTFLGIFSLLLALGNSLSDVMSSPGKSQLWTSRFRGGGNCSVKSQVPTPGSTPRSQHWETHLLKFLHRTPQRRRKT